MVDSYEDLIVWQKSVDMVVSIYEMTTRFPDSERYGMRSQITRAAVSVPANIAEGSRRGGRKDYAHFVSIARGSLGEVETYIVIAARLGYISDSSAKSALSQLKEIGRMLTALRTSLLR